LVAQDADARRNSIGLGGSAPLREPVSNVWKEGFFRNSLAETSGELQDVAVKPITIHSFAE
jgi:hypothetical protein